MSGVGGERRGPAGQLGGLAADDHRAVAGELDQAGAVGQRGLDVDAQAVGLLEGLLDALLLGVAREAGDVDEADRDVHVAARAGKRAGLHVLDLDLLGELLQVARVHVLEHRQHVRQRGLDQRAHDVGDLFGADAALQQRLVHEHADQAGLGVGQVAERLRRHAHDLQQRAQRHACPRAPRCTRLSAAMSASVTIFADSVEKPIEIQICSAISGLIPAALAASLSV